MRNKLKNYISILLCFFLFHKSVSANEPFVFNVTEIEIINNGNTVKGYKGGTATTDDGLKIEAENFVYDKVLNILNAYGNVKVTNDLSNYKIFTENLSNISIYKIKNNKSSIKFLVL